MTRCFKCGEYPPDDMFYCLQCGARLDGEQNTVICNMEPGQATFVGTLPTDRSKRRMPALITSAAVLLTVLGASIYLRERPMPPVAAEPELSIEAADHSAAADGVEQTPAKPAVTLLTLPRKTTVQPAVTTTKQAAPIAVSPKREPIAPEMRPQRAGVLSKRTPMQVRIEIVDGVNHCYAIPGGRRIPC